MIGVEMTDGTMKRVTADGVRKVDDRVVLFLDTDEGPVNVAWFPVQRVQAVHLDVAVTAKSESGEGH